MLFCLNSCYFIEQAILDEKITATQNRGVKKKNPFKEIFEEEPWSKPGDSKKKTDSAYEMKSPFKEVSETSMKKGEFEGESLNIPVGTKIMMDAFYTDSGSPLHIYLAKGNVTCPKNQKNSILYYKRVYQGNYLVLIYSTSAAYKADRLKLVEKITSAIGFSKTCY